MRLDLFQDALQHLSPLDFEKFVADVLRHSERFRDVRLEAGPMDRGIDVEAIEIDPLLDKPRRWVFQIKKTKVVGVDVARYMFAVADMAKAEGPTQVVLVAAGSITKHAREVLAHGNIQVWDAQKLAEVVTPDILEEWFGARPESLTPDDTTAKKSSAFHSALQALAPGKDEWSQYQRLVADILEFLFCPPLELPHYELPDADSRNRRDIIFENPDGDGFWAQIRNDYSAHYIVVDAKNYVKPITKRSVLDIAHYLKPYGCGMFAILVSREGPANAAAHATREQWIGRGKMIVHLDESRIKEMLELKATGGDPHEVVRRQIADFRMAL